MPGGTPPSPLSTALQLHQAGRLAEAEAAYGRILRDDPGNADALHLLGLVLARTGRADGAIALISRAIGIRPSDPTFHLNLGHTYASLGRFQEAIAACREAVAINPRLPHARLGLANALQCAGQIPGAIAEYRAIFADGFDLPEARHNLALALASCGNYPEAIEHYRHVLHAQPNQQAAMSNLGAALVATGQLDEAITVLTGALELDPNSVVAHDNLAAAFKHAGRMPEAMRHFTAAARASGSAQIASHALQSMQYDPAYGPAEILAAHCHWFERYVEPLKLQPLCPTRAPSTARKLRIGYLSSDFRAHAAAQHLYPLLAHHDRTRFEIFCYSNNPLDDDFTLKFKQVADAWRPIQALTDAEAAELIRSDRIDILIDASMHMGGNRALLLARQPAPVQIAFIAYPGTTGNRAVGYRLTDSQLDPTADRDRFYTERSIRLPHCFWCYDPLTTDIDPGPPPALSNGYVTFGCLNSFAKINESVLQLWSRVMRGVTGSRLTILSPAGSHRDRALQALRAGGVEPHRVRFTESTGRQAYLESFRDIDISLDPFPCNGHMTTLDGLWMGVPVISLIGQTVAGRAGLSILSMVGLEDFATQSQAAYVDVAADLAGDLPRLSEIRATLRDRMKRSPVMNHALHASDVESAYVKAWLDRP